MSCSSVYFFILTGFVCCFCKLFLLWFVVLVLLIVLFVLLFLGSLILLMIILSLNIDLVPFASLHIFCVCVILLLVLKAFGWDWYCYCVIIFDIVFIVVCTSFFKSSWSKMGCTCKGLWCWKVSAWFRIKFIWLRVMLF